ncbi:TPA: hypothetical protein NPN48_004747 [Klebsiella pneumoniae]|nr:hypothetical protein [Klebsiella pneumoniae]
MTITLQAVNELIASLESAGELSTRETKVMALAKAFKQLAAENVVLKESRNNLAEFIHEELDSDYPLNMNLDTPATDRIVAGIKADAIDEAAVELDRVDTVASTRVIGFKLREFAKQLREGDGK